MPPIYISYRLRDADVVERIAQRIILSFGRHTLQINPTKNWASNTNLDYHVDSMMHASETILIVIGKEWAGIDEFGRFRLSTADVPLYSELKAALHSKREVLILLIDGAELPVTNQVPEAFHGIYDLQVVRLRSESFKADLAQFVPAPTVWEWLKYWFSGVWLKRRTLEE